MSTMLDNPREVATTDTNRRRRAGWIAAAVLLGGTAAAVVAVLLSTGGLNQPAPTVPPPVVLPVPTPTVDPVEREKTTAFQQALPDEALAFAVSGQLEDGALLDAGAVEAYRLTYTDGAAEVTLRTGQWASTEEAVEAMSTLEAAAVPAAASSLAPEPAAEVPPADAGPGSEGVPADPGAPVAVREEPVLVGGLAVGRVVISGSDLEARALWTNGATLLELRGPGAVVPALYDAFPM